MLISRFLRILSTKCGGKNAVYKGNWKIRFLTSGTLTFTKLNGWNGQLDVFFVGGGGAGGNGIWDKKNGQANTGDGGSGGKYSETFNGTAPSGGSGGSGIVIIRNAREAA